MNQNLFDLRGQAAIVTGSSRGIGRAIAERLAQHGARVVISSRKQEACDAVAAELNARHGPGTAIATAANISSKDALRALVERTLQEFGRIDTLVCNAASNPYYGPMAGITDEQFRKILDNNVLSNHWLVSLCASHMVQARRGSVIIISSVAGLKGNTTIGAYGVSKAADMALARNLAHELGPQGVRVNCIAPGLIRTDFADALLKDPERLERVNHQVPLRRVGEPDEIAGAAVFLAAPAGAFVTGTTLVCDGGATI